MNECKVLDLSTVNMEEFYAFVTMDDAELPSLEPSKVMTEHAFT